MQRTYYAMKRRLGGEKLTRYDKLCWHYWPVPGCLVHMVSPRKQEILFDHYVERPQASHRLYWKTHPDEYKALLAQVHRSSVSDSL